MSVEIIKGVKDAFPVHPIPTKVLLDELDNSEFSYEIRSRFVSKAWTLVTLDDWVSTASIGVIVNHMLPEAFHYYLPSILCASLNNKNYIERGLESILPNNQRRKPKSDWWKKYISCFNAEQKKMVRAYALHCFKISGENTEEKHLARIALEDIWH